MGKLMQPTNINDYFNPQQDKKNNQSIWWWIGGATLSLGLSVSIPMNPGVNIQSITRLLSAGSVAVCGGRILWIVSARDGSSNYRFGYQTAQDMVFQNALTQHTNAQIEADNAFYEQMLPEPVHQQLPGREGEELYTEVESPEALPPSGSDPLGLVAALAEYGVLATWDRQVNGPTFTRCLINPAKGTRFASVQKLGEDLKRSFGLEKMPFITQSGKAIAIDIPRTDRQTLKFSDYIQPSTSSSDKLKVIIGIDLEGRLIEADLSDPNTCHFLIGATTGGGKSEFLRTVLASICWRYSVGECQVVLIDPKQVTFPDFESCPWLYAPLCLDDETAIALMGKLVEEMMRRYQLFRAEKASDISGYNKVASEKLARLVVIIDEYAMLIGDTKTKKNLEQHIKKLGAMARAAGIHLFVCTQRPEANVVTPLIRDNLPARVALKTASTGNSEIILGQGDTRAHNLLGHGDLLYQANGETMRLQALLVTDWGYLSQKFTGNKPPSKSDVRDNVRVDSAPLPPHTPAHDPHITAQIAHTRTSLQHTGFTESAHPHIRTLEEAILAVETWLANSHTSRTPLFIEKSRDEILLLFKALIHHKVGKIKTIEYGWGVARSGSSQKYKEAKAMYLSLLAEVSGEGEHIEFLKSLPTIGFPETRLLPATGGVYFVFDGEYNLYYVGSSDNILFRWNGTRYQHHRLPQTKALVAEGKTVKIGWVLTSNYLNLEAELVAKYKPLWNGTSNNTK